MTLVMTQVGVWHANLTSVQQKTEAHQHHLERQHKELEALQHQVRIYAVYQSLSLCAICLGVQAL
jgi:hypothetical protein